MAPIVVRDAREEDVVGITDIQNALLATTATEWTEVEHTAEERTRWLRAQRDDGHAVVVAVAGDEVVGWAAFGEFRDATRWPGYRFTVEHTIHVRRSHWGSGVGRALMDALVARARAAGKHVMIAAVDGGNQASIRFHERLGFVQVARLHEVGAKHGRWLDLVLLELVLDDRADPGG